MTEPTRGAITLTAVGDMMFDTRLMPPRVLFYQPDFVMSDTGPRPGPPIHLLNTRDSHEWLHQRGLTLGGVSRTGHAAECMPAGIPENDGHSIDPFALIASELRKSDVVLGNLECPLSSRGRRMGNDLCYSASPRYAASMAAANVRVVSFANNHCMDYGEQAFHDTLSALARARVHVAGAARHVERARDGVRLVVKGTRFVFLAYNLVGPPPVYGIGRESGVLPFNEPTAYGDLERLRSCADVLVVSVHWGAEGAARPSGRLVSMARGLIDHGADIVVGHHPHVPGSIELHRAKPIVYSLGNFIFGHGHRHWRDNMMVTFRIARGQVLRANIVPIGGDRYGPFQPAVLDGARRAELLEAVSQLSEPFGTKIGLTARGHGVVQMAADRSS